MKNSQIVSAPGHGFAARPLFKGCFAALLAGFISVSLPLAICRAQPSSYEAEGEEVLTRGPVHEAFAAVVSYNPEPGIIVRTRPPELIEELPPEERPEGDDVAWIPGYWGWDDERNDYLWISGTWRILPPGREWMAGYWRENDDGYQWISGYWADTTEQETTYLPPPPATLEVGANIGAPSDDYGWSPGCWIWREDRYAWRAGYWAEGRADWVWVPAYYVWTPRGVIFVEGFWDYPVERRGVLFAPVYYRSHGYSRRGYSYSPRIAINLSIFLDNLFLRPRYHHYYFGDYYGSRYEQDGFYASITFQSSRQGYDPFYSHNRWEHRRDRDWDHRFRASYQYRRENEAARPPRTWSAQLSLNLNVAVGGQVRVQLAAPIEQLARSPDSTVRFQAVAQDDRQRLARRGREVQETRDQRRTVEAKAVISPGRNAGAAVEPARVAAPRSPIAAKRPKAEAPGRPQNADRRNTPAETRQPERNVPAERRTTAPRGQEAPVSPAKAQPDAEKRNRDMEARAQAGEKSRQKAAEAADRNKQQAEERRNAAEAQARDDNKRQAQESQQKAQQDTEKRNRDAEAKSQATDRSRQQAEERAKADDRKEREESQQRVNEAARGKQQAEERRNAAEANDREEAQKKAQQEAGKRNRDGEAKSQADDRSRQQGEERANAAADQAREESQQRADESAAKAKRDAEDRANAAAARAKDESQRKGQAAQQNATKRANDAAKAKAEAMAKAKQADKEKTPEEEEEEAKQEKEKSRGR